MDHFRTYTYAIICFLYLLIFSTIGTNAQKLNFPKSQKVEVYDTIFDQLVLDEYRWMENLKNPDVSVWVEKQNELTTREIQKYSSKHNSFLGIDKFSFVQSNSFKKQKDNYFLLAYYDNIGVPAIFLKKSFVDDAEILVDPNFISTKDKILLNYYKVSGNGKYLAYQFSRNGSDWMEIKVVNIATGIHRSDHLKNVKFSNIAWRDDGFYYSRYPDNDLGITTGQEIFYHKLGTDQDSDELVFKRQNKPSLFFKAFTTSDERFLLINEIGSKTSETNIYYIDYQSDIKSVRPLITKLKANEYLEILDYINGEFYALTSKGTNNNQTVKFTTEKAREWKVVIPHFDSAFFRQIKLMQDVIITVYEVNRKENIFVFDYQGNLLKAIEFPFGFSVTDLNADFSDKTISFFYEGYTQPKLQYEINLKNFEVKPVGSTTVNFDYRQYETVEMSFLSFDSVAVPLYFVRKKSTP
jgi:prolyl oligopeptidase